MPKNCVLQPNFCIECPEIAAVPAQSGGVDYAADIGWTAGAYSVDRLYGKRRVRFRPAWNAQGAVVGMRSGLDNQLEPTRIERGIQFFTQGPVRLFRVVEHGSPRIQPAQRLEDDVFEIRVDDGRVFYAKFDPVTGARTEVYASTLNYTAGSNVVACLYVSGDSIE